MDDTNNMANHFAQKQTIVLQDGSAEQQTNTQKPEVAQVQASEQHKQEKSPKLASPLQTSQPANEEATATKLVESNKQPKLSEPTRYENSRGLESLLKTINQGLKAREFQGNLPLSIKVGSSVVFQAVSGKKPTTNKVTSEEITLLQQALKNPQGVQGAIRIRVGSEIVFHVRNGKLKVDKLELVQGQTLAQESFQQANKEVTAQIQQTQSQSTQAQATQTQSISSQATQSVTPSLETEIASLRLLVSQQQQQLDQMNQKLDRLLSSPPVVILGSNQLKNWFDNLHSKIQTAGQQAVTHVSNQLEQNKTTLRSKIQQMWSGVKETVTDKIHAASNAVQTKAGEIALGAMSAATTKLASAIGEKLPDGSFVIENRNLNQRLEVNGHNPSFVTLVN